MSGNRGLGKWAVLLAALSVAACGSLSGPGPRASAIVLPSATPPSVASLTPAPTTKTSADQPLPPGVTVVDAATDIRRLDWSPNGTLLAVLTWGGTAGTGRVDVLDLTGKRISSFEASDVAWVDDAHLMTFVASPDDIARGTVTVQSIGGSGSAAVPGTYGGLIGNGRGSVALLTPVQTGDPAGAESFEVWANGRIGPRVTGFGQPVRWSPDGRLLALVRASGGGSGGTGSPIPGTLSVVRLPDTKPLVTRPLDDVRLDVFFSPDGASLATTDGLVLRLASGPTTQVSGRTDGWTRSGELVVVGQDQRVSLWTPEGTAQVPDAFGWAAFGPDPGDIATLAAASESSNTPVTAVVRRARATASIALNNGVTQVAWSSGGVCFLSTGGVDAQLVTDDLLRVELAAN